MLTLLFSLPLLLSVEQVLSEYTSSYEFRKAVSEIQMDATTTHNVFEQIRVYAETGDPVSQYEMWLFNDEGTLIPKNQQIALAWLTLSAEQEYPPAMYQLGKHCYDKGKNQEAFLWFLKAALLGNTDAQVCTAICYRSNTGTFTNDKIAQQWMIKAAHQGNAQAQYDVAVGYQHGKSGCEVNIDKAIYWYSKSAEQNYPDACTNLGECYLKGIGVEKNLQTARELFLKAAEQNDPLAMCNLGVLNYQGIFGKVNPQEAAKWFERSAKLGHPDAQFALAALLEYGEDGIEQDQPRAFELFLKAANQDHIQAQFRLANCYASASGTSQDNEMAFRWYKKAADQGFSEAEYMTGLFYLAGKGVENNPQLALEYLTKAAAQGHEKAQETLDKIREEEAANSDQPSEIQDSQKQQIDGNQKKQSETR